MRRRRRTRCPNLIYDNCAYCVCNFWVEPRLTRLRIESTRSRGPTTSADENNATPKSKSKRERELTLNWTTREFCNGRHFLVRAHLTRCPVNLSKLSKLSQRGAQVALTANKKVKRSWSGVLGKPLAAQLTVSNSTRYRPAALTPSCTRS